MTKLNTISDRHITSGNSSVDGFMSYEPALAACCVVIFWDYTYFFNMFSCLLIHSFDTINHNSNKVKRNSLQLSWIYNLSGYYFTSLYIMLICSS